MQVAPADDKAGAKAKGAAGMSAGSVNLLSTGAPGGVCDAADGAERALPSVVGLPANPQVHPLLRLGKAGKKREGLLPLFPSSARLGGAL